MTEAAFNQLVEELKKGNNEVLQLLQPFQGYCQKTVMIKSRNACSADESYDIFIDAILDFRKNILTGKVQYKAVRAYLAQICWNKWMEKSRSKQRQFSKRENVEKEFYKQSKTISPEDEWVKLEEVEEQESRAQHQLKKIQNAMNTLSGKCQQILKMAIIEEITMADIAKILGLANANVAKTTKSRCYKQLVQKIRGE